MKIKEETLGRTHTQRLERGGAEREERISTLKWVESERPLRSFSWTIQKL